MMNNIIFKFSFVVVFEFFMLILKVQGKNCNIVVSKDNSGNFKTISEAINVVPNNSTEGCVIKVKKGFYEEIITIPYNKTNVQLIGDGMHMTVVSWNRSAASGFGLDVTGTLVVYGNGFTAIGMTFENVAGPDVGPASALITNANHLTFYQCQFLGYQDTIFTQTGMVFFRDCVVEGTVDFICGDGAVFFQRCLISVRNPLPYHIYTITAQQREPNSTGNTGLVINRCTIEPSSKFYQNNKTQTYLGRPWGELSTTVVIRSYLHSFIDPSGWTEWHNSSRNAYYAEYNNVGPGSDRSKRVVWSKRINTNDAQKFTVQNFIQGDKWIPKNVPYSLGL